MTWALVIIGWWALNVIIVLLMWRRGVMRERQERAQSQALSRPAFPFPAVHGGKSSVRQSEDGHVAAPRHRVIAP